jgi:hypothetical protein
MAITSYAELDAGGLTGQVWYSNEVNSYLVSIYYGDRKLVVRVFGNGVDAENCLLDFLEHPDWTILKYS